MVSKQGQKFLRWMRSHDELKYFTEINRDSGFDVDYMLIESLCKNGYLTSWMPPDALPPKTPYDIPERMYRISDTGKAYLESICVERWKEIRNWAALIIALAAFIKSFFF